MTHRGTFVTVGALGALGATHDSFYGPTHREVRRHPIAGVAAPPRDSAHDRIVGDELRLTYCSYPADAPVLTHSTIRRVR